MDIRSEFHLAPSITHQKKKTCNTVIDPLFFSRLMLLIGLFKYSTYIILSGVIA